MARGDDTNADLGGVLSLRGSIQVHHRDSDAYGASLGLDSLQRHCRALPRRRDPPNVAGRRDVDSWLDCRHRSTVRRLVTHRRSASDAKLR